MTLVAGYNNNITEKRYTGYTYYVGMETMVLILSLSNIGV